MPGRASTLGILCALIVPLTACAGSTSEGAKKADAKKADAKKADAKKADAKKAPDVNKADSPDTKADAPKAVAAAEGTPKPAAAGVERCVVIDGTRRIKIHSQAGHAAAKHDLSIDLKTRTMSGSAYRLEGDDPIPVEVNRTLDPKEFDPLVEYLRTVCGTTTANPTPRHSAPGGSTRYDVFDEDGTVLVLAYGGSATIAPGETVLELTRDQFKALGERWPKATPGT